MAYLSLRLFLATLGYKSANVRIDSSCYQAKRSRIPNYDVNLYFHKVSTHP